MAESGLIPMSMRRSNAGNCLGIQSGLKIRLIGYAAAVGYGVMILLPVLISASAAFGQQPSSELRAAATIVPPFIMEEDGALTGFSVDLWNAIAAQMKVKTNYEIEPDVTALEEAVLSKKADVGIAPLVITLPRVKEFDFSLPVYQVGLQIMVPGAGGAAVQPRPLVQEINLLFSLTTLRWLGIAFLLVLIPAHLVWFLDRHEPDGVITYPHYRRGIFQAMYWALSCLATQAEKMPHQWMARVVAILWMFTGIAFVASYTAQLTTRLTVQQIRGAIEGPADLTGRQVGTIANTYAVDYLRAHNVHVQTFNDPDQAFQALLDKKVEAIVWESPVLRYYVSHEGQGHAKLVGNEFYSGPIAILCQLNSPLRRQIDIALLALHQNGTYERLKRKWFGEP